MGAPGLWLVELAANCSVEEVAPPCRDSDHRGGDDLTPGMMPMGMDQIHVQPIPLGGRLPAPEGMDRGQALLCGTLARAAGVRRGDPPFFAGGHRPLGQHVQVQVVSRRQATGPATEVTR